MLSRRWLMLSYDMPCPLSPVLCTVVPLMHTVLVISMCTAAVDADVGCCAAVAACLRVQTDRPSEQTGNG